MSALHDGSKMKLTVCHGVRGCDRRVVLIAARTEPVPLAGSGSVVRSYLPQR